MAFDGLRTPVPRENEVPEFRQAIGTATTRLPNVKAPGSGHVNPGHAGGRSIDRAD
jgi:hypothetical protein